MKNNKLRLLLIIISAFSLLVFSGCGKKDAGTGGEEKSTSGAHVHDHEHGELPYEWSGNYNFAPGKYTMVFGETEDASCAVAFLINEGNIDDLAHHAHHIMEAHMDVVQAESTFTALPDYGYVLALKPEGATFTFEIQEGGEYIIFMEHMPEEFDLKIVDASGETVEAKDPVIYEDDHNYHK